MLKNKLSQIKRTHVLQHDQSDCGVACLLSIIRFYNGNNTIENLRKISGTTIKGTTLLGLYQSANTLGFDSEAGKVDIDFLKSSLIPLILHVNPSNTSQHYIIIYKYDTIKGFLIGDPSKGVYYLDENSLSQIWKTKACLKINPNENFSLSKQTKINKAKFFKILINEDITLLLVSVIFGILITTLGMSLTLFSQKLIDVIIPQKDIEKLIIGTILVGILLLLKIIVNILRETVILKQSYRFNNRINTSFFEHLLQLPNFFFKSRKTGEFVARLNDSQRIQQVIKTIISSLIINILISIISIAFLFFYSATVTMLIVFSLPIFILLILKNNQKILFYQREVMVTYAINESNYIDTIKGIEIIKTDTKEKYSTKLNNSLFSTFQDKILTLGKMNIKLTWQSNVASTIIIIAVLLYTSLSVIKDQLLLGEMMAIIGVTSSLLPSIANIALFVIPLNEAKVAFDRMYEFTSIQKEKLGQTKIYNIESISLSNISFRFPGRMTLFKNFHWKLEKGKIIALIGNSGIGKSTLSEIIQYFYEIEDGEITINNNINLNQVDIKSYRMLIGVVSQKIHFFNGTILENILLGDELNIDKLKNILNEYKLDEFFNQFPLGINTLIGEEGINLSGGQKQVIALARVLYKKPQFLILDEITSAMDLNIENLIFSILKKIKPETIILFISHKLHTLHKISDRIAILENGSILIEDSPENLMKSDNMYSIYIRQLTRN